MQPTLEQLQECYRICSALTNMYLQIQLVRLDKRSEEVYILAGKELEFLIRPNGKVRVL
jgi:hypothetical protein